ncbi:MAG: catechol 2,3-dioxygenase-like lactoylglutathione lyase family enzyme [Candidatus Azotimanducaceae bacterium]|jgi:catechol 2,3-dioxygenase-like lactoylglutathione lyase family enzyme
MVLRKKFRRVEDSAHEVNLSSDNSKENAVKKVSGVLLAFVFLSGAGMCFSLDRPLAFGLLEDHLNLVYSVSDGPATARFYGEVLGLEQMSGFDLPGGRQMLRYRGGESELKFIVAGQERPQMEGGMHNARGIRLLVLLLPVDRRAGIVERMQAAGIAVPEFTNDNSGPISVSRGMTKDYDGNQVEIAFFSETSGISVIDQAQIGLAVSDMAAMGEFLQQVLALEPSKTQGTVHRYDIGKTQIKFWQAPATSPAWVGRPHEKLGITMVQFVVADVYAARDIIVARGGKIHTQPYVLGDLAVVMFVEGPDGILVEFGAALAK